MPVWSVVIKPAKFPALFLGWQDCVLERLYIEWVCGQMGKGEGLSLFFIVLQSCGILSPHEVCCFLGFSLGGCFAFVGSPKFFSLLNGFAKERFSGEALLLGGLDDVEELFSQRRGIFGGAVCVF